jgi:1-acyl-sn-glycerol-3-phosphate acyltransferase
MKFLLSLYIWIVGGSYFGILCLVTIFLTFFIPQKKLDPWIKTMLRIFFKIILVRVKVEGADKIEPGKTYLFMSNHVSLFDVPLLAAYIPVFVRGVEASRQFSWPVYGWVIRRMGNIPIDRENIHSSIRSIRRAEKRLIKGKSIVILPEAHRTLDGKLRPFKKLPFFLAKRSNIPIVPIGLSGLFRLKRKGSWLIRPTILTVKFGDIIDVPQIKSSSIEELRDLTRAQIQELIEIESAS